MSQHKFKAGDTGKTRDGCPYRVVADDRKSAYPLVVLVKEAPNAENVHSCDAFGRYLGETEHPRDLMPPTRTVYVNFHADEKAYYYSTKETAMHAASCAAGTVITAIPVELPGA